MEDYINKSIIRRIYHKGIIDDNYRRIILLAIEDEFKLISNLNFDDKKMLCELLELINEIRRIEYEHSYTEGFKEGSKSMLDIIEKVNYDLE